MKYILGSDFPDGPNVTEASVSLGCWKSADLPSFEGKDDILDGKYENRSDAVHKCFAVTRRKDQEVFAVTDGGKCQGLTYGTMMEYMKQGRSTNCANDGKGGPEASQIYYHFGKLLGHINKTIYLYIYLSIYLSNYLSM